jgi:hypothetical protein
MSLKPETPDLATDIEVRICTDCVQLWANGETPVGMSEDETKAWLATVTLRTAGYVVAVGGNEDNEHFSSATCDSCGDTRGGNRWDATMLLIGAQS